MKVKELIEELKELDQEKGIWLVYDGYVAVFDLLPDDQADEFKAAFFHDEGMEKGDYIINVG